MPDGVIMPVNVFQKSVAPLRLVSNVTPKKHSISCDLRVVVLAQWVKNII